MFCSAEDFKELQSLEECLWRAESRFDPELMDQLFHKDFVEFGRSGRRYERTDMIFPTDPNATIDAKLPLEDFHVVLISAGVALVTYTSEVVNGPALERGRRSSIWLQINGHWKLRFHQGTPC